MGSEMCIRDRAYKYKGKIHVPPLEMVDDVLTISKCGAASIAMNAVVNAFMGSKKLLLNSAKCAKIHVGRHSSQCPQLKAQDGWMNNSDKEKYLGDIIQRDGKPHATIVERISKGNGIVANIRALLTDIPLANRRIKMGLELRQAWFVNGILYNSEVWPQITQQDMKALAHVDHYLLRSIIGAHSKVAVEQLYLETGTIPLHYVMKMRRMIYLQTILKRTKSELTRKVYDEMKKDPMKNDWSEMVKKDFDEVGMEHNEKLIEEQTEYSYKNEVRKHIRKAALTELQTMR